MVDLSLKVRLERHLNDLPVLPTALGKLMALDPNDPTYFDRLLRLVESEPNFSARVLANANTAASAPDSRVGTLRAALARIGTGAATNLVLAASMARVFVPRDDWQKSLWRHALQVAAASRALAVKAALPDVPPDEAYAAALLHDVGRFVMFQEAPDQLRRIDEGDWDSAEDLLIVERSICGLTHTELGAIACERWRLPESILAVVRDHHVVRPGPHARLVALVRFADVAMFPSALPDTPGYADASAEDAFAALGPKLPPWLTLTAAALHVLIKRVSEEAATTAASLGVA